MYIKEIDNKNKKIIVSIPLTKLKSKIRIKKRSYFNEYGEPVSTAQEKFTQSCYVEWQIGYDVITSKKDKLELTTIKEALFIDANGNKKTLYELSEYIYYFYKWNIVTKDDLSSIKSFLQGLKEEDFIEYPSNFAIERSHPINKNVLGIDFLYTQVKYPILVHKFGDYEILTEIKLTERQYAIGVQSMLYFCFPITELKSDMPLINRTANTNETCDFEINRNNINIFLEMFKIFGILSKNHNKDITTICNIIQSDI